MRVLVMWADDRSPNLGVQALAAGVRTAVPATAQVDFVSHRRPPATGPLSLKRLLRALLVPGDPLRREICAYDLVVDVGEGDSFTTIYGLKRFLKMVGTKLLVTSVGVPLVLAPQTLGPWNGRLARWLAHAVMSRATAVWARDSDSALRAAEVGSSEVRLASDLVFAVASDTHDAPLDGPRVLLNVSGLLWHSNSHIDHVSYRRLVEEVVQHCHDSQKEVALLCHVLAPGAADEDVALAQQLSEELGGLVVLAPADLAEARRVMAGADLVIGARMHACLNALSLGVPTIAMAYSDKFTALFGDLAYQDHVVDLRSRHTTGQALRKMIDRCTTIDAREQARAARARGRVRAGEFVRSFEEFS